MSLEIRDLHVFYGDFHVLHGVSLTVEEGQLAGVIGANGHGKSTLLKAICGLVPVRAGSMTYRGERINGLSAPDLVARGIVYVAEVRHLFAQMTVRENLMLGAYLPRARKAAARNLDQVYSLYPRLKERERQLAGTLSGGEAQMLALGRGLMSEAAFMAIDEPSLGLAPGLTATMLDTIQAINARGITILLVEQSLALIADRVHAVHEIEEGRIAALAHA
ncbi:ABC transporter ATP-binding protein [Chthonobacter albigriseus]|uniref:ABC transporter ATP-binding protein n=1 Tax=Chthonobacter albigriseus TaxID=1683161 RepID=UPI0015EF2F50|nr:ABC transporter ATP-binding protein [Chthonobacter albigriseus]